MLWIWVGLVISLSLIEILKKNLVTIWYVGSAIIALLLSFFIDNYFIQFLVFAILGSILMFTLREKVLILLKQKFKEKLIDKKGIVVEEVRKNKFGKVKINKRKYIATSNKKINVGHFIKVVEINGTILTIIEDNNE